MSSSGSQTSTVTITDSDDPKRAGVAFRQEQVIAGYRLLKLLGRGGGGEVWEAVQPNTHQLVALKLLTSGQSPAEARVLGRLHHRNIVKVYDAAEADDGAGGRIGFVAMDLITDALPITQYASVKRLKLWQRLELLLQVADALQQVHETGTFHRDIKPGNVLVDAAGTPVLVDFGIATPFDPTLRERHGTAAYMSPEQTRGEMVDARSDLFSLGVLTAELLTEALPHDIPANADAATVRQIIQSTPPRLRGKTVPPRVRQVLEGLLAFERPARAYKSAAALAEDVRRLLDDRPLQANSDSFAALVASRLRQLSQHRILSAMLCMLLGLILAGLTFQLPGYNTVQQWLVNRAAMAEATSAIRIALATINHQTDLQGYIDRNNLTGVSLKVPSSLRTLHTRVLERIADLPEQHRPTVVAFDVSFRAETEFDEALADAVDKLSALGIQTLAVTRYFDPALASPSLQTHIQFCGGVAKSELGMVFVAAQARQQDPRAQTEMPIWPGLALAAASAHCFAPVRSLTVEEVGFQQWLKVQLADGTSWQLKLDAWIEQPPIEFERPRAAFRPGDRYGTVTVPLTDTQPFKSARLDYLDLLEANVGDRLAGKVLLIGDELLDGLATLTNGKVVPGVYMQAAAIEQLCRLAPQRSLQTATGQYMPELIAATLLMAAALCWLPITRFWPLPLMLIAFTLIAQIVWCSGHAASSGGWLINPLPLVAALAGVAAMAILLQFLRQTSTACPHVPQT